MAIEGERISVTTTATALASGGSNGVRINVLNAGGPSIYLGGSASGGTVTSSTGAQLGSAERLGMYIDQSEVLYAITSSGTATVHVLRGGV